jgi:hypothetical protein
VPDRRRGIRLSELRLTGAGVHDGPYTVSFLDERRLSWRPLSIIAGPSQTGKTSVIDFARYCLGDDNHPQHPEILTHVRAASLETALAGEITTIERSATGRASSFASVWKASRAGLADTIELRLATEPPSDPQGLSQYVLAACGLDSVMLPEAPTKGESGAQMLSIRDLFKLMWLPNERLDNKNLVLEHAPPIVSQKLRQTVDVMFGVHDAAGTDLAARAQQAGQAAREAERAARSLREVVQAEHPMGAADLEEERNRAHQQVQALTEQLAALDRDHMTAENTLTGMRRALEIAQSRARTAAVRVRNRESLMERLAVLRGQYADDKRKLTFLKEAERLFDPLQVTTCPACFSPLGGAPSAAGGVCSLCGHRVSVPNGDAAHRAAADASEPPGDVAPAPGHAALDGTLAVIQAEHKATARRLDDLTDYWNRLDADLKLLRTNQEAADRVVEEASTALNRAVDTPAPFLAGRDAINDRRTAASVREQKAQAGLRLWERVRAAEQNAQRLADQAARLRAQRKEISRRPSRVAVVARLSSRFGEILRDIEYPKLSRPRLDDQLKPSVRGLPYTAASSGGLVLISLAWYLAIWEIAHEQSALAPGLLIIDSPQKNLGRSAKADDTDFADTRLVENFYQHARRWLASSGTGAQLVVIDNSPPELVADDVVIRYTRNQSVPPYGLIDNAID